MVEKAIESVKNLDSILQDVDDNLDLLFSNNIENINEHLKALESAKLRVAVAYSAASFYYILLKAKVNLLLLTSPHS